MKRSITAVIFLSILLAAGCGGAEENGTDDVSEQAEDFSDPEALGNRVGEIYGQMYVDLHEIATQGLPAEELAPLVAEMKEDYIGQFVELGAIREGMTDEQKSVVDRAIRSYFYDMDMEIARSVTDMINFYRPEDGELASNMSQMNILTQYADYELLRSQSPDEATRLGI
ncbi:MAG: hypothetical protein U9P42_07285 [Candidatus Fermentibacteria bacterium]|nr:hypothetical protein [Candidatus Fermentibacteria bacterium]